MTVALRKIETANTKKASLREDQWRVLCLFILMAADEIHFDQLEIAVVQDLLDSWKGPLSDTQEWMLLKMKQQIFDSCDDPNDPHDQPAMLLRRFLGDLH